MSMVEDKGTGDSPAGSAGGPRAGLLGGACPSLVCLGSPRLARPVLSRSDLIVQFSGTGRAQ